MNIDLIKKYVIYSVIIVAVIYAIGSLFAAEKCSEGEDLVLEKVLTDLNCSEQDKSIARRVFSKKVSECEVALIESICKPSSGEGLKEEDSLRLQLNNTTVKDSNH